VKGVENLRGKLRRRLMGDARVVGGNRLEDEGIPVESLVELLRGK
jgi:hypothetical protein